MGKCYIQLTEWENHNNNNVPFKCIFIISVPVPCFLACLNADSDVGHLLHSVKHAVKNREKEIIVDGRHSNGRCVLHGTIVMTSFVRYASILAKQHVNLMSIPWNLLSSKARMRWEMKWWFSLVFWSLCYFSLSLSLTSVLVVDYSIRLSNPFYTPRMTLILISLIKPYTFKSFCH